MPPAPSAGTLDLSTLSEQKRLCFYGALFSMAFADARIDESESELIMDSLDLEHLSEDARRQVFAQAIAPPRLETCLEALEDSDDEIRFSLMLNLIDIALADDSIEPAEHAGLRTAREMLGIPGEVIEVMHEEALRAQQARGKSEAPHRPLRYTAPQQEQA